MKYKAIPILIFLSIIPTLLTSAHAQPQIVEITPGFITSTLYGKRIPRKDYWKQQGTTIMVFSFFSKLYSSIYFLKFRIKEQANG
jgi:hypothetical protein